MKYYYYFLFRLYKNSTDSSKENHKVAKVSTATISSLFLFATILSLIGITNYFNVDALPSLKRKYLVLALLVFVYIINYQLFIKKEEFLNQNFTKDKKGGFMIVLCIVLLVVTFIIVANKNRDKITVREEPDSSDMQ